MYAFIDESGDPGIGGKGSQWLIVGCALVPDDRKAALEERLREFSGRATGGRPLHFSRLSHDTKKAAYGSLAKVPWWGIVAAADTTKPLPKSLRDSQTLYNDVLKEVVRRVLWRSEEYEETPDIIIDRRQGRFDLPRFKRYLEAVNPDEDAYTNWERLDLDRIAEAEPEDEPCLSVPDGLAHATYRMLEPNEWGDREQTYFQICAQKLWLGKGERQRGSHYTHNPQGRMLGNGIILLPKDELPNFLRDRRFSWLL